MCGAGLAEEEVRRVRGAIVAPPVALVASGDGVAGEAGADVANDKQNPSKTSVQVPPHHVLKNSSWLHSRGARLASCRARPPIARFFAKDE